ncbi:DUF4350 domain-containing protein [Gordonia sp. VNK1]|jgi:hypothetical protein|uniref:DUF4350 domain-containing protein n=1 Tax=Gordonia oleivorans TaxID=3156618 RepID=UPI0032B3DA2F
MTTDVSAASTAAASPGPMPAPPRRKRRRALWIWLPIAAVILVIVAILAIVAVGGSADDRGNSVPGDPGNYSGNGSSALANIIGDHGVDVKVVRGLADLTVTPKPDGDTTVVVTNTPAMTAETARAFAERVRGARRVVLVDANDTVLDALGLPVTESSSVVFGQSVIRADCSVAGIEPTDTVTPSTAHYVATDASSTVSCFPSGSANDPAAGTPGAEVVVADPSADLPETIVMTGAMTTNSDLADVDNAGVTVRTMATGDNVLWYVPRPSDRVESEDDDEESVLPSIVWPLFFLAFFVAIAVSLWRGRRFGPLVAEPLPAVVKAIETTRSRGRLYRKAADAGRAAAILRVHTTASIARYLGLAYDPVRALDAISSDTPIEHDPALDSVVAAVASATGRDSRQVAALLAGPLPTDDTQLAQFTSDLTDLEKEVRRTP